MDRNQIRKGMVVRGVDGDKLGKVAGISGEMFIIEKGLLFKEDFEARLDGIVEVRGDEIIYARADEAAPSARETQSRPSSVGMAGAGDDRIDTDEAGIGRRDMTTAAAGSEGPDRGEVRVPLVEEELDVQKQTRQSGGVRVTKSVVTEQKEVSVPVTREELEVERVPASGDTTPAGTAAFVESEIIVPIVEEEVVVTKRPVVREEVRVRKHEVQDQRAMSADVRREEAQVEDLQEQRRERPTETNEPGMRAPSRDDDDTKR